MPTNFVIGQILMLFGARQIAAQPRKLFTFPLKLALSYSAFIFLPVTAWYFYKHTGWSTVYLRPENEIPFWAGPFILLQYFFGMVLGAGLAQLLIQVGHKKFVYVTLGLGVIWLLGIFGLTLDEYLHVGTYAQYHSGQAVPLFSDTAFQRELNIMGALLFVPAIVLAILFRNRAESF